MQEQMTLKEAIKKYPDVKKVVNDEMLEDDCYVVRIDKKSGLVEIGYSEDEWFIS